MSSDRERAGRDAVDACSRIIAALEEITDDAMSGMVTEIVSAIESLIDARIRMALADAPSALERTP